MLDLWKSVYHSIIFIIQRSMHDVQRLIELTESPNMSIDLGKTFRS